MTDPLSPISHFYPTSFEDVSAAVRAAKSIGSLVVRSGGYSTFDKKNVKVVVDLKNLRSVSIDAVNQTAHVQAGARFSQLEREAIQQGRLVKCSL